MINKRKFSIRLMLISFIITLTIGLFACSNDIIIDFSGDGYIETDQSYDLSVSKDETALSSYYQIDDSSQEPSSDIDSSGTSADSASDSEITPVDDDPPSPPSVETFPIAFYNGDEKIREISAEKDSELVFPTDFITETEFIIGWRLYDRGEIISQAIATAPANYYAVIGYIDNDQIKISYGYEGERDGIVFSLSDLGYEVDIHSDSL